ATGAPPSASCRPRRFTMTAKKKRTSSDPAPTGTKKKSAKTPAPKTPGPRSTPTPNAPSRLSALDAAALVLRQSGQPMNCPELIEQMAAKGYWTSPKGKTPSSTLYTVVTMLPKWAPTGATIKRAWGDPVGDSDLLRLDLDAFHQAANDFAPCVPVGLIQSVTNLQRKGV